MIEVHRFVHQLDVGKTQKEGNYRQTIFPTKGHHQSTECTNTKEKIGVITYRSRPFKTVKAKMKLRCNIEFLNPAVTPESDYTCKH